MAKLRRVDPDAPAAEGRGHDAGPTPFPAALATLLLLVALVVNPLHLSPGWNATLSFVVLSTMYVVLKSRMLK